VSPPFYQNYGSKTSHNKAKRLKYLREGGRDEFGKVLVQGNGGVQAVGRSPLHGQAPALHQTLSADL
jgi:hypothetical protein